MERLKFRCCGARVALVLGVFLGGCQVTLPPDLVIQCSDPGRACPPGYECGDDDVCVRDGVPDGGGSDASPDVTFDGDSRDSGPGDARPRDGGADDVGPDVRGDAGPSEDAGPPPPPPPPLVAEISADGRQTVDGIAVGGMDTNSIYVVGTHFGGQLCFNAGTCSAGLHGVYVATFRVERGALDFVGATFFEGGDSGGEVDIKPAGIGVLEGGQLVIGGTYTRAISNTNPVIIDRGGEVGAFVLELPAPGPGKSTEPARAVNWPLSSEGSMSEIDAHGDTWCAVGFDGTSTNPAELGFLVCEVGEDLIEHGLGGGAANDLDMSGEPWQIAWNVVGLSRATAASFDVASGVMGAQYRSAPGPSTGELVATNGSDVVLVARESANSLQVLSGILVDDVPGMPSTESPAWTVSLGATDGVFARDMHVANSQLEVHVVGQVAGEPTGILAGQGGGNDGNRGYYAVISDSDEARVRFANDLGTSDFRAIAVMDDGAIVIGGQGTGPLTFPEVMLGDDGLDGFIMVIPPTPSDP